jgi:mannose-6-phosphate isomerase-like protein (cupin superfamily)
MRRHPLVRADPGRKSNDRLGSIRVSVDFAGMSAHSHPFDVEATRHRLSANGGGYEVVHRSPGLELGVYVLVAPEPDRQQPHEQDEVYIVLDGSGTLDVEGVETRLVEGEALFVPAGAEHRFTAYEHLSLLVVFNGPHSD